MHDGEGAFVYTYFQTAWDNMMIKRERERERERERTRESGREREIE